MSTLAARPLGPSIGRIACPANAFPQYQSGLSATPAAIATAVLTPSVSSNTMYLTQAILTADQVTAVVTGNATITDGSWTLNFRFVETVSAGGALVLIFEAQPLMATTPGTAITVTVPVISGGSTVAVSITGYEM